MTRNRLVVIVVSLCAVAGMLLWGHITARAAYAPPEVAIFITRAAMTATAEASINTSAVVVNVVDGDTIDVKLEDGQTKRLRYIGIDSPEANQSDCFSREATAYNYALVHGLQVKLERDVSETDRYNRLLRYVYLLDGRMVNEELVKAGYAQVSTYPPDVRYVQLFLEAQRAAKSKAAGLWGECKPVKKLATPVPGKGIACVLGCEVPPEGCVIKGNISSKGEKIYHVPGQEYYTRTVITPEKGERWFCTDAEAIANGWRKSLK